MKIDKTTPPLPASQIGELATRPGNARPTGGSEAGTSTNQGTRVDLGATTSQLRALEIDIGNGAASAAVIGGDLTHEYVSENADYRS